MPNLRSSPAADISREFQTGLPPDIRTRPYIFYEVLVLDSEVTLLAGEEEYIEILAPAGYIYEVRNARLSAPEPLDATLGDHQLRVYSVASIISITGISSYNKGLMFNSSFWEYADLNAYPLSGQLQALQTALADENVPIKIHYINNTDVNQTQKREYRLLIRKVKV